MKKQLRCCFGLTWFILTCFIFPIGYILLMIIEFLQDDPDYQIMHDSAMKSLTTGLR